MNETVKNIAQECLDAAYKGTKSFPEIVQKLIENGYESYQIDYRRHVAIYFLCDNSSFELPLPNHGITVAEIFDTATVQAAIQEAQQQVEGYTYQGFCEKVMKAGCAGYMVSFLGKRVLYFGRTAETHVEHFPQ